MSADLTTDPTRNLHGGNPESVAAFKSAAAEDRRRQLNRVVEYVRSCGARGATCDETEQAIGMSHQTCSARFTDAKRAGLIAPANLRRPTRTGRAARVFIIKGQT